MGKVQKICKEEDIEVSRLLEEIISEGMLDDEILNILEELIEGKVVELDFKPISPKKGLVSTLVRELRDERESSLSGQ